jgi:hypothetical protein
VGVKNAKLKKNVEMDTNADADTDKETEMSAYKIIYCRERGALPSGLQERTGVGIFGAGAL